MLAASCIDKKPSGGLMAQAPRAVLKNLRRPTAGLSTDSNDDVMVMVILPVIEMRVSPPQIGEANLSRRFVAHLKLRQKASQRREKSLSKLFRNVPFLTSIEMSPFFGFVFLFASSSCLL
jgi:hypothetical protein